MNRGLVAQLQVMRVDFRESDEQSMIRAMVRDFAESVLPPTIELRDKEQIPPTEEWQTFCQETGLQGITISEEYGGMPVDDISEAIIIEELARVDASISVFYCVHVGLCSKTISLHGTEPQKQKYLSQLAADKVGVNVQQNAVNTSNSSSQQVNVMASNDSATAALAKQENRGGGTL